VASLRDRSVLMLITQLSAAGVTGVVTFYRLTRFDFLRMYQQMGWVKDPPLPAVASKGIAKPHV
jgi:hypothetical protein